MHRSKFGALLIEWREALPGVLIDRRAGDFDGIDTSAGMM
jgi:hypothetical protein